MKTLKIGIATTLILWLLFSIYCKTFDPMRYSNEARYFFCCFVGGGWFMSFINPDITGDKN